MSPQLARAATAAALLAVTLTPLLVTDGYVLHILIMVGINVILASGLDLVLGHLELLSLAQIAFFGIGAYTSALLSLDAAFGFWQAVALAGIVSGAAAFLVGLVALRLRGAYFVIVTLGLSQIIYIIVLNWIDFTRGPMGVVGIQAPAWPFRPDLTLASKTSIYYLVLAFCLVTLFLKHRLTRSYIGKAWRSIREDENLAESVGVSAFRFALLAFVAAAALAGVAGSLYAHYMRFLSPEIFEFSNIVAVLVMVIIGGRATLLGPVLGAALFTVVLEYLRVAGSLRLPILGLLLILATLFFPQGLANIAVARRRAWSKLPAIPVAGSQGPEAHRG